MPVLICTSLGAASLIFGTCVGLLAASYSELKGTLLQSLGRMKRRPSILLLFGLCVLTSFVFSLVGASSLFDSSSNIESSGSFRFQGGPNEATDGEVYSSGPKKPASTKRRIAESVNLLQERMRKASGAHSVVCKALYPPPLPPRGSAASALFYGAHGGGYNYSFTADGNKAGSTRVSGSSRPPQFCCLVPQRAAIKKAKPAVPVYTPSSSSSSSSAKSNSRKNLAEKVKDKFMAGSTTRAALLLTAETAGDPRAQTSEDVQGHDAEALSSGSRSNEGEIDSEGGVVTGADGSQWTLGPVSSWQWSCLPSFIIAGTQKSGSTALSAFLLDHPQVSMGYGKEIHFFDKPINLGLLPYLVNFASVDGSSAKGSLDSGALSEFQAAVQNQTRGTVSTTKEASNQITRSSDLHENTDGHEANTGSARRLAAQWAEQAALDRVASLAPEPIPMRVHESTEQAGYGDIDDEDDDDEEEDYYEDGIEEGENAGDLDEINYGDNESWEKLPTGHLQRRLHEYRTIKSNDESASSSGVRGTKRSAEMTPIRATTNAITSDQHRPTVMVLAEDDDVSSQAHKAQLEAAAKKGKKSKRRISTSSGSISEMLRSDKKAQVRRMEAAPPQVPPSPPPLAPPFVNGEATPFYLAERDACRSMAEEMPAPPALIVLLRDPVDRAYSEYQMKVRRVESQTNFEELLNALAPSLLGCLASVFDASSSSTPWLHAHEDAAAAAELFIQRSATSGRNITSTRKPAASSASSPTTANNDATSSASSPFAGAFTDSQGQARSSSGDLSSGSGRDKVEECLPPILTEHAKWNDIRKGLREVMRYGYMEAKARSKRKARAKSRTTSKDSGRTRSKRSLLTSETTAGEDAQDESYESVVADDFETTTAARRTSSSSSYSGDGSPLEQVAQCFYFAEDESTSSQTAPPPMNMGTSPTGAAGTTTLRPPPPPLDYVSSSRSALPQGTFAAAPPSPSTTRRTGTAPSTSHLDVAAVRALNPANTIDTKSPVAKETARARLHQVRFDLKRCVPSGFGEVVAPLSTLVSEVEAFEACAGPMSSFKTADDLNEAVGKCIKVKHGISSQYIYRSLYAAQLAHCYQSIPKDRILVLDSNLLRKHPREALRKVHAHLGIADYAYPDILGGDDVSEKGIAAKVQAVFDEWYPSFEDRTGWKLNSQYDHLPHDVEKRLRNFFGVPNKLLEDLTGGKFDFKK